MKKRHAGDPCPYCATPLTADFLQAKYEQQVARYRATVEQRRANGVDPLGKGGPERKFNYAEICELYDKGWSKRRIARHIGAKSLGPVDCAIEERREQLLEAKL
jgi:hypothetical protein